MLLRHPAKSAIKVIDFGSSCFEHEKSKGIIYWRLIVPSDDARSLHVHSKPVLSLSRSHLRDELSHGHRYVEPGLYISGAQDRLPHLPRRKRAGAVIMHNGGSWSS